MAICISLRNSAVGVFVMTLAFASGCSSGPATGTVKGTVTFNGNPVKAGTVNFLSATGAGAQATLDESGHFQFDAPVSAGEYKVYVSAPVPTPQQPGTKSKPMPKFEVSKKFQDPSSSGVTVKVQAGENTIPVELKG